MGKTIARTHAKQIGTLADLMGEIKNRHHNFFISFGICRSSKHIIWDKLHDRLTIKNHIDESIEHVKMNKVPEHNIGVAMKAGNFYMSL